MSDEDHWSLDEPLEMPRPKVVGVFRGRFIPTSHGLYACPTCGENVTRYGRRCDRCERNLEEDRLERESGR